MPIHYFMPLAKWGAWSIAALFLHACSSLPPAPVHEFPAPPPPVRHATYQVQRHDSLSKIAQRYGYNYQDIATLNGLSPPYTIYPGQILRLPGVNISPPVVQPTPQYGTASSVANRYFPANIPANKLPNRSTNMPANMPSSCRPGGNWVWPSQGNIRLQGSKGKYALTIMGRNGQPIYAAAAGRVVYSGPEPGLNGYFGHLLIIEHNAVYRSVYAHNQAIYVHQGEQVASGQPIAAMGLDGNRHAALRFEIRCRDRTVDPLNYLPHA